MGACFLLNFLAGQFPGTISFQRYHLEASLETNPTAKGDSGMRCVLIKEVSIAFDTVLKKIPKELKRHGFQILSSININKELHDYLGLDFNRCTILSVSNLQLAYKALLRDKESALLQFIPLLIIDKNNHTTISTFKPTQLFPIIQIDFREDEAAVLEKKIREVLEIFCKNSTVKNKADHIFKAIA